MECKVISKIFDINKPVTSSKYCTQILEVLLILGKAKQVNIEFLEKYCKHSDKPSQIYWRDIPIMGIKCLGREINFQIQNDKKNTLFFLLRQMVQSPSVSYITILIQLRLPPWERAHEFIIVINRTGKVLIIPTDHAFSSMELKKVSRFLMIRTERNINSEQDFDLIDILIPDTNPFNDFKIRF